MKTPIDSLLLATASLWAASVWPKTYLLPSCIRPLPYHVAAWFKAVFIGTQLQVLNQPIEIRIMRSGIKR